MIMNSFPCIQRIFCIDADRIEQALQDYPDAFHGGVAVVTFNNIYSDDPRVRDYDTYCTFFKRLQAQGVDVQVNLSSTIGHGDRQRLAPAQYPTMENPDGSACLVAACPRSDAFHKYLHKTVTDYAVLHPSVLWIDDDFRLTNHGVANNGCFCADCVATFNAQHGFSFGRMELYTAIARDEAINGQKIRPLWLEFNRRAILTLAGIIADAAHAVDPDMIIGYMQCSVEGALNGMPHYRDLIARSKNRNGEVWFRHGAGFYCDRDPLGVVVKNVTIGRLCAATESANAKVVNLVEEVTSPYIRREKSMRITLLEAEMNIGMAGAQGIMDEGIKPNLREQLQPGNLVATMHENYHRLARMYALIEGKHQLGVYPYFDDNLWLYNDPVDSVLQMSDLGSRNWMNLLYMGIPVTFRKEHASALVLSGKTVRAMPEDELRIWLSRGIYADGTAALEINRRLGTGYTGVREAAYGAENLAGAGTSEHFTDHPLNGDSAGFDRYNIWFTAADNPSSACLESDGGEALSYSMNAREADAGVIGAGVYENALGGRIAVMARGPWCSDMLSQYKTTQIQNVMNWVCGGRLPVLVKSRGRMICSLWADETDTERTVFLFNTDFDAADDAVLYADGEFTVEQLLHDGSFQTLGSGSTIALPMISPWSTAVLRLRRG